MDMCRCFDGELRPESTPYMLLSCYGLAMGGGDTTDDEVNVENAPTATTASVSLCKCL